MTDKQIIIEGVDVNSLYSDQIACMNRYEVANLFIKTVEKLVTKEQEYEELKKKIKKYGEINEQETKDYAELKADFEQYKSSKQASYEAIQAKCNELELKNRKLEAENEKLAEYPKLLEEQMKFNKSELELSLSSEIKRSEFLLKEFKKADKQRDNWREKARRLKQTLAEIKSILELYANSKIGEKQPNGTYKIVVEAIGALGGTCIAYYDPRPAKQGLQKISEVEDDR